jgi:mono/diheme cytochrome c family protein
MRAFGLSSAFFLSSALLLTIAPTSSAQEAKDPSSGTGKDLFLQYCASCHGPEAKGNGPAAPALKDPPRDLTLIAANRGGTFPSAEILAFIDGRDVSAAHGSREMPVWGKRFGEAVQPGAGAEAVRRGTAKLIVDYLATIEVPAQPKP